MVIGSIITQSGQPTKRFERHEANQSSSTSHVMYYLGATLIVVLAIALIIAVSVLVVGVGKIVYGIAHYYLRERKPERQFTHPEFGVFDSDGAIWSCELHRNDRRFQLVIGGNENAPSEGLLAQAGTILGRLALTEQSAIEFLRAREEETRTAELRLYSLEIVDDQLPNNFTFEFIDPHDDSRVWRVEFVAGEPKETGFDD